jgi:hypothetical protein
VDGNFVHRAALVSVAANRIADNAVRSAPRVGHLIANFPQLREELYALPFVQQVYAAAFQRFRVEPDRAVNQLNMAEPESLK